MEASGADIVIWLVQRSEETSSPNMVQDHLQAVRYLWHHTNKPLGEIPILTAVIKGLLKIMEASYLNRLGFGPEHIKSLMKNSVVENGLDNLAGL